MAWWIGFLVLALLLSPLIQLAKDNAREKRKALAKLAEQQKEEQLQQEKQKDTPL